VRLVESKLWTGFVRWIDRDIPWLQSQQLLAVAPLCFTLFVAPGPGSTAMWVAFGFYIAVTAVCIWRLAVFTKKRWGVDRLIQKNMLRRFREGRWLPLVGRRK
jgi:hypothetical protein